LSKIHGISVDISSSSESPGVYFSFSFSFSGGWLILEDSCGNFYFSKLNISSFK
jgi:hypothetical protein